MGNIGGFTEESRCVVYFLVFFFSPRSEKSIYEVLGKEKCLFLVVPEYIILF